MIGSIGYLCGCDDDDDHSIFKKVPVDPRKRYVYNIHCPTGPGIDCPLVIDPTGAYFRRDGWSNHYLCGRSPDDQEPEVSNIDVDYEFFEENVWPVIANRARCFEDLKVGSLYTYSIG